jgi:hypothetical protein
VRDGFIPHQVLRTSFQANFLARMRELWKQELMENIPVLYRFMFTPLYQSNLLQAVLGKIWFVWIGKRIENAFNAVSYVARYTTNLASRSFLSVRK